MSEPEIIAVCPFKVGDLVTGTDRHYERSIYRLEEDLNGEIGQYMIVSYAGKTDFPNTKAYARIHDEFRLADPIEIKKSSTRSHKHLKMLLYLLRVTKHREYI